MTDFTPTAFRDAWVNPSRTGLNTGSGERLVLQNTGLRAFVRPVLPNLSGRTILSAVLRAHVKGSWAAQTVVLTRVTQRWVEGRITSANQPTVTAAGQVSTTTAALTDGGVVEWDVTAMMQLFADGTDYFGFRLTTDAATRQTLYGSESSQPSWELTIEVSDAPDVPSNLRPDGGAVPTNKPHLGWDFVDLGGDSTEQAASRVQVDSPAVGAEPDAVAPDFDSGWVTNVDPHYDLATSAYVPPVSPAQSTFWRVNVRDGTNMESGWSDWAEFTVTAKPTLVVDSPVGVFGDPTPQIQAHLSSGTLKAWQVVVTGPNRADVRARSGLQTGPLDWTVPLRDEGGRRVIREGKQGWARIRMWDTVDRADSIGSPAYLQTWIALNLDEDVALTPPTGLSVIQLAEGDPRHQWSWHRTEAAEAWLVQIDGHTFARLEPEDVTENAGAYSWVDSGILPPLRRHTVSVVAVDNGGKKSRKVSQDRQHTVEGVWIVPLDGSEPVVLAGGDVSGWVSTDAYASYKTLSGKPRHIFYGWRPRSGTFEGFVDARADVWATRDLLEDYAVNHLSLFRLVWGSQATTVRLRDIDVTSSSEILPNNLQHIVRFTFDEWGD